MKLLAALFGQPAKPEKAPQEAVAPVPPLLRPSEQARQHDDPARDEMLALTSGLREAPSAPEPSINIWDMDTDADTDAAAPVPMPSPRAGGRRNRTRLIGFDPSGESVADTFSEAPKVSAAKAARFPVGWLLVVDGPGRGHCFTLTAGMSQIGRGEDQAVQLDFGDTAISRNNHAAVVFDPESGKFMLGHGGKANIVRLNDRPVISNEDLEDGDQVRIGDTTLILKVLSGAEFDWTDAAHEMEEHDHVAIA